MTVTMPCVTVKVYLRSPDDEAAEGLEVVEDGTIQVIMKGLPAGPQ